MKSTVELALVQLDVAPLSPEANVSQMLSRLTDAAALGADIVVFPELVTVGYCRARDREYGRQLASCSEPVPGPTTTVLGEAARNLNTFVVFGMSEAHSKLSGVLFNSAVLVGPDGAVIGVQRKVHVPGEEKHYFATGDSIEVWETDLGRLACCVCADFRVPEMARVAALEGAEIQLVIANSQVVADRHHETTRFRTWAQTRASENANYVAVCNRVGNQGANRFAGMSCVVDPSGGIIVNGTDDAAILVASLSHDILLQERTYRPGFIERRPELYSTLTRRW